MASIGYLLTDLYYILLILLHLALYSFAPVTLAGLAAFGVLKLLHIPGLLPPISRGEIIIAAIPFGASVLWWLWKLGGWFLKSRGGMNELLG